MKTHFKFIIPLLLSSIAFAVGASAPVLEFSNPEYKERYHELVGQLRCLVCQNQTIAESNADLAVDLRQRVYAMVEQGSSDAEIIDFMAERYGEFVLYNPRIKKSTLILWFAPFIIIGVASTVLVIFILRRNKDSVSEADISASVRKRINELLENKKRKDFE